MFILICMRRSVATFAHRRQVIVEGEKKYALQRHCTKYSKQLFPEMKLRGTVPNTYIHGAQDSSRGLQRDVVYLCQPKGPS